MVTELIKTCPECTSGYVDICYISKRPHCGDCGYWAPVNHDTLEDAVIAWNRRLKDQDLIDDPPARPMRGFIEVRKQEMTPKDFCLWLQGFLREDYALSTKETDILRKKLDTVFEHDVAPAKPTVPSTKPEQPMARPRC